jgi:hypothetical protein
MVDRVVPFESLRAEIEAVVLRPASEKKRNVERKVSSGRADAPLRLERWRLP